MSNAKPLYMIAGGTDGYVSIVFSFDEKAINQLAEQNEESYAATDSETYIMVPADATYESLGICKYSTAENQLEDKE
jgi:hypothetical protein